MNIILLYSHLVSYYIYFAFKKETILSHHLPLALSATVVLNILESGCPGGDNESYKPF